MLYVRRWWYNASIAIRLDAFGRVFHLQQAETREPQGDLRLLILRRSGRDQTVQHLRRGENRHVHTLHRGSCSIPAADGQFSPQGKFETPEEADVLDTSAACV